MFATWLPSGATEKQQLYHGEIVSVNPGDAIDICGRVLKRAKLACSLREDGVAYSLSPVPLAATLANHGYKRG